MHIFGKIIHKNSLWDIKITDGKDATWCIIYCTNGFIILNHPKREWTTKTKLLWLFMNIFPKKFPTKLFFTMGFTFMTS